MTPYAIACILCTRNPKKYITIWSMWKNQSSKIIHSLALTFFPQSKKSFWFQKIFCGWKWIFYRQHYYLIHKRLQACLIKTPVITLDYILTYLFWYFYLSKLTLPSRNGFNSLNNSTYFCCSSKAYGQNLF